MHIGGLRRRDRFKMNLSCCLHLLEKGGHLRVARNDNAEAFSLSFKLGRPCVADGKIGEFICKIDAPEAGRPNIKRDEKIIVDFWRANYFSRCHADFHVTRPLSCTPAEGENLILLVDAMGPQQGTNCSGNEGCSSVGTNQVSDRPGFWIASELKTA